MRRLAATFLFLGVLLLPRLAHAQTSTATAKWTQTEAPAVANTFSYVLKNSTIASPVVLAATCVPAGTGSSCTSPVQAAMITGGTYTLTASNGFTSAVSDPFSPGTVTKAGGFTITVTISFP